jgi:hypothetical protein
MADAHRHKTASPGKRGRETQSENARSVHAGLREQLPAGAAAAAAGAGAKRRREAVVRPPLDVVKPAYLAACAAAGRLVERTGEDLVWAELSTAETRADVARVFDRWGDRIFDDTGVDGLRRVLERMEADFAASSAPPPPPPRAPTAQPRHPTRGMTPLGDQRRSRLEDMHLGSALYLPRRAR